MLLLLKTDAVNNLSNSRANLIVWFGLELWIEANKTV